MDILKNVFKRKMRAFLTIFGIVIGILALVMMGSIAEKLTLLVDGGTKYYSDKVTVSEASNAITGFGTNPLSIDKIADLEKVDGVARASSGIAMMLDEEMSSVNMGVPPNIQGTDFRDEGFESFKIFYSSGRALAPDDNGKVVVGSDLVKKLSAKVGNKVKIRGKYFEVVGIMEKTLTAPDSAVMMTLLDSQDLYAKTLPEAIRTQVDIKKLVTSIVVFPKKDVNPDELAKKINAEVKGVKATGPADFQRDIAEPMKPFKAIIFGVALISLIVGGLSIINTMTMSVSERTREVGIRKAIGASEGSIIKQFLLESAFIGFLGGIIGLGLGYLLTILLNKAGADNNMAIFLLTPRLAIGSISFSLFLGIFSGIYPAWYASRLDPIKALRYE